MAAAQAAPEEAQVSLIGSTAAAALSVPCHRRIHTRRAAWRSACCSVRMYPPVADRLKPACHTAGGPIFFVLKSPMTVISERVCQ